MTLGSLLGHAFIEIDHYSIIPVHKINLDTLDAPRCHKVKRLVKLPVNIDPFRPQTYADTFLLGIPAHSRDIRFRIQCQQIILCRPSFINKHILEAVGSRIIHQIHIRRRIYTCLKIHSINIIMIPPVPQHLTRTNPRPILFSLFCKKPYQVAG